jgi:hypothetical protein
MSDDLQRVTGLWLKDGKRGKFMTGKSEGEIPAGSKLLVFKNDRKQGENDSDYVLYAVAPEDQLPMRRAEPVRNPATVDGSEVPSDDIPF